MGSVLRSLRVPSLIAFGLLVLVLGVRGFLFGRGAPATMPSASALEMRGPSEAALERLAAGLNIKTTTGDLDALDAYKSLLGEQYPNVFARAAVESFGPSNLVLTFAGSRSDAEPAVLLAHMDVVDAGAEGWSHPPFGGSVAEGRVWGRGALDNKGSVHAILEAIDTLLAAVWEPSRTIIVALGGDEEVGGRAGAGRSSQVLAERYGGFFSVLDEGMMVTQGMVPGVTAPVALIGVAEKGYGELLLQAKGEGGHASMPPRETALTRLAEAVGRLRKSKRPSRLDPIVEMMRGVASELPWHRRVLMANAWFFGPLLEAALSSQPSTNAMVRTTVAPTMFQSGIKANVLPREAEAVANVRFAPWDSPEAVLGWAQELVVDLQVEVSWAEEPIRPSRQSQTSGEAFGWLAGAIKEVFPEAVIAQATTVVATDSRYFRPYCESVYRFAPFVISAETRSQIHGRDESVSVEDFGRAIAFYQNYIDAVSRMSVE